MNLNLNLIEISDLFIECYENVDFRSGMFKKGHGWKKILSIFRFTNETRIKLRDKVNSLGLDRYSTAKFKIHHEIIDKSNWEEKILELYNEINDDKEIYDTDEIRFNDKLSDKFNSIFKSQFLNSSIWGLFTKKEVNENNLILFSYSVPNKNNHHNQFNLFLRPEMLKLGEKNIYDVINRTMALEGYSSQNSLYFLIVFPIYINVIEIGYIPEILSIKVRIHEKFENAHIIFNIYSDTSFQENLLIEKVNFTFLKDSPNTIRLDNGLCEVKFELDFKDYNCTPNFKMRVWWEELPEIQLFEYQYPATFLKTRPYKETIDEEITEHKKEEDNGLKFQNIINLKIAFENDYLDIVNEINLAYKSKFFDCVYILVRKLLENLLIDCLREYYSMSNVEKFYNEDKGRFLTLGRLRKNFNEMIKEKKFNVLVGQIPQKLVDFLEIFKETGNSSAHSFFSINNKYIIEDNKDKLEIVLSQLTKVYRNLRSQLKEEDNQ